ncbi:MAG: polyisoprenoid-binding protein [Verrucomicrobiaceae bacterium]|nr:MAG: polyisoprenoid-binding protein [Verrucomicrobiaceae bacterium]
MKNTLLSFAAFGSLFALALPATAQTLKVDPVHSSIRAGVGHLGVTTVWGRFNDFEGTIDLTAGKESVSFTVKTTSVDTAVEKRDTHLRSKDFFNVEKFATATFKSTTVKKLDDKSYEVTGDFTLLGVTHPVTTKVSLTGTGKGMEGEERTGFQTQFTVKRSSFGINFMEGALSDEVKIEINAEAITQP